MPSLTSHAKRSTEGLSECPRCLLGRPRPLMHNIASLCLLCGHIAFKPAELPQLPQNVRSLLPPVINDPLIDEHLEFQTTIFARIADLRTLARELRLQLEDAIHDAPAA